jgi:signal transduction histidine kinase
LLTPDQVWYKKKEKPTQPIGQKFPSPGVHPAKGEKDSVEKLKYPEDSSLSPEAQKLLSAFIDRHRYSSLGVLLKGVIHNLNGSLQILSMQMELLQRMLSKEESKVQDQMEKCLGQMDQFREMLDRLIRKGMHDEQDAPQSISLNELLEEELSLLHHNLFFKHQVRLHKDLASPLPLLTGSYGDFSQGLGNLVQNALEAMEGSSYKELTLTTRVQGNQIRLSIKDSGCGIPEELKPRLFQPFLTSKGGKHPGLGLYLARRLLGPHGAVFQVSSREGETIFEVSFPLKGTAVGKT